MRTKKLIQSRPNDVKGQSNRPGISDSAVSAQGDEDVLDNVSYRPGRAATFGEFIERWKAEVLPTQKPSSARAVRSHLKCYKVPELGKLRLDQFGVENQQRFITRMPDRATNKTVSHKTVLNVIVTLSSILTTARNWGYNCEQIHIDNLRLPQREAPYEARHFTVEQVRQILFRRARHFGKAEG